MSGKDAAGMHGCDVLSTSDLVRIRQALDAAVSVLRSLGGPSVRAFKTLGDPLTEADLAVDEVLRRTLPRDGEGWLSEETADDPSRLGCRRVWIVDPIDGTREFVEGLPEWSISIGLVEAGEAVAGGLCNPATGEMILGGLGTGVSLNGVPVRVRPTATLDGAEVLASRSECRRGEWQKHAAAPFRVRPMGSVAWKLGCVAAGLADATWTEKPRSEWDVAAGVALVTAAGGVARLPDGSAPRFNQAVPKLAGLFSGPGALVEAALRHCSGPGMLIARKE